MNLPSTDERRDAVWPGQWTARVPLGGLLPRLPASRRDAAVAALNGLLGDHLHELSHPLAWTMQLRSGTRWLVPDSADLGLGAVTGHVLVLLHGVCRSDRGWRHDGHDPGIALQRLLGLTPLHARYNSGLHVADNGRALALLLERLLARWPVPVRTVSIVGHGVGGLVARSAALEGQGMAWRPALRHLVFIATPHLGLPLAQAGHWLHRVLDLCPYTGPYGRLSGLRSAGLLDMQEGRVRQPGSDAPVPLPADVLAFAMAGTIGSPALEGSRHSDGLVPLDSALGDAEDAARRLGIPDSRRWIGDGMHYLELQSHPRLLQPMLEWLQQ
ncbi:permease [Ideonella sp. A 288]|uniref:permease n=1 Tax=Ideonella sp. A 288 TaxID=1962181 RepID=UPI000B4AE2F9|nr:permease [Ideonella sp. A 288]